MSLRERLGLLSATERAQNAAFRAIEQAGGVELLVKRAGELQAQGDPTVLVTEKRFPSSRSAMVELRWGMVRSPYLAGSWWESYGVEVEAFVGDGERQALPPRVSFTDGVSWHSFDGLAKYPRRLDYIVSRGNLTEGEAGLLREAKDKMPLDYELKLAMKVAQLQQDFRYGEGKASEAGFLRRDRDHRVIFP